MVTMRVEIDVKTFHEPFIWFPPPASLCGGREYKGEGPLLDYRLTFAPRRDESYTTEAARRFMVPTRVQICGGSPRNSGVAVGKRMWVWRPLSLFPSPPRRLWGEGDTFFDLVHGPNARQN